MFSNRIRRFALIILLAGILMSLCACTAPDRPSPLDVSTTVDVVGDEDTQPTEAPAVQDNRETENPSESIADEEAEAVDLNWLRDKYAQADMSAYENIGDSVDGAHFVEMTTGEFLEERKAEKTFVVVFSHAGCPQCQGAIPVLGQFAKENDLTVAYIDTRKNPEWRSNKDIDNYDEIAYELGYYFAKDEDGSPHMYVPHVFFIKDGEVVFEHLGAGATYDGSGNPLNEEQIKQQFDLYLSGVEAMLQP